MRFRFKFEKSKNLLNNILENHGHNFCTTIKKRSKMFWIIHNASHIQYFSVEIWWKNQALLCCCLLLFFIKFPCLNMEHLEGWMPYRRFYTHGFVCFYLPPSSHLMVGKSHSSSRLFTDFYDFFFIKDVQNEGQQGSNIDWLF